MPEVLFSQVMSVEWLPELWPAIVHFISPAKTSSLALYKISHIITTVHVSIAYTQIHVICTLTSSGTPLTCRGNKYKKYMM